jgi:hypothetical protein
MRPARSRFSGAASEARGHVPVVWTVKMRKRQKLAGGESVRKRVVYARSPPFTDVQEVPAAQALTSFSCSPLFIGVFHYRQNRVGLKVGPMGSTETFQWLALQTD